MFIVNLRVLFVLYCIVHSGPAHTRWKTDKRLPACQFRKSQTHTHTHTHSQALVLSGSLPVHAQKHPCQDLARDTTWFTNCRCVWVCVNLTRMWVLRGIFSHCGLYFAGNSPVARVFSLLIIDFADISRLKNSRKQKNYNFIQEAVESRRYNHWNLSKNFAEMQNSLQNCGSFNF